MTSPEISTDSIVVRNADILFSKVDNEMLAISVESGYCYSLNDTAGKIWMLLEAPVSVSELSARLCKDYTVDEQTCLQGTLELLQDLQKDELVRVTYA